MLAVLLAACATTPPQQKAAYQQASDEVQRLEADPLASEAAAAPLAEARTDLTNADDAARYHMTDEAIHWSYLATREAQIGEAMTAQMRAHRQVAQAEQERDRIVQQAQRRRTQLAEERAHEAEERAQQAEQQLAQLRQQQQNAQSRQQIEEAQQRAQLAEQQSEESQRAAQQAQQQAQQQVAEAREQAQQQAADAREQAQHQSEQARAQEQQAREQLAALQARNTERGPVIVLGNNVLFATGRDKIEPGALSTLQRIAQFLSDHPKEKIQIEGFTDSRGSDALNDALSQRRAEAVAQALEADGVDPSRIEPIGRGSSLPLASNATAAGRQQNRRVEIVFSNIEGVFPKQVAEAPR